MVQIEPMPGGVIVILNGLEILRHSPAAPMLQIAKVDFRYCSTQGGMQRISAPTSDWVSLQGCEIAAGGLRLYTGEISVDVKITAQEAGFFLEIRFPAGFNLARLRLPAERSEAVYGGGVQFGRLNLRGRRYPIWTSEMGLGRHPLRPYTWLANWIADAGGAYWNAYYPQPSFLSTRGYGCLIETDGYSVLDFRSPGQHFLEVMGDVGVHFFSGKDLKTLLRAQADRLGIMPEPPAWVFEGGILGIQGGLPYVRQTVDRVLAAGARLTGIWTQDWSGVRILWQGKRIFWDWKVDESLYPDLKKEIQRAGDQGMRWLTYINPYFNTEGKYFQIAKKNGYLVRNASGGPLVHHVAGFQIGSVDLTNPQACQWFKQELIQKNMLGFGMGGWMADYGEDVPEQARFHDGRTGKDLHNLYPLLWAQLNREAVEEAGLQKDVLIFHRSGYTRASAQMNMNWGGDQIVYWNRHDGFPAGVAGGLSACMSGVQYYHTDAGGYFSFRWIKRTKEVFFRWCEANAFSPVLRTHEGNRPWAGVQPWQDAETLQHFARMTRLHAALAAYLKYASEEAQRTGIGMLRPFCLENPGAKWQDKQDAYYLGSDLLVYPVMRPHVRRMRITIPEGEWVGLFNGKLFAAGAQMVPCPIGQPLVFYRQGSAFTALFDEIGRNATRL